MDARALAFPRPANGRDDGSGTTPGVTTQLFARMRQRGAIVDKIDTSSGGDASASDSIKPTKKKNLRSRISDPWNLGIVLGYAGFTGGLHYVGNKYVIPHVVGHYLWTRWAVFGLYVSGCLCLAMFAALVWLNPGYVPQYAAPTAHIGPFSPTASDSDFLTDSEDSDDDLDEEERKIREKKLLDRFCKTCYRVKNTRMKHCRDCDRCVDCMDHHCFWTNNCIGFRNHRLFFVYVSTQLMHLILAASLLIERIRTATFDIRVPEGTQNEPNLISILFDQLHLNTWMNIGARSVFSAPAALGLLMAVAIIGLCLTYLWATLMYDISKNQLVNEVINQYRYKYLETGNPFDKGFFRNWKAFIFNTRRRTARSFKQHTN